MTTVDSKKKKRERWAQIIVWIHSDTIQQTILMTFRENFFFFYLAPLLKWLNKQTSANQNLMWAPSKNVKNININEKTKQNQTHSFALKYANSV